MCVQKSVPAWNKILCDKFERHARDAMDMKLLFCWISVGLIWKACDFNVFNKDQFVSV